MGGESRHGASACVAWRADVEALLVRRHRDARYDGFIVPVDVCYELTGLLRQKWRGIDGGDEARAALDELFASLRTRSGGGAS